MKRFDVNHPHLKEAFARVRSSTGSSVGIITTTRFAADAVGGFPRHDMGMLEFEYGRRKW